jgi:hypothetical protein
MATNRDLLKEAIADAKAVKDMAIANAKAALEESFTPQLKSMLSAKLQEMEEEEEEMEEALGTINDPDTPTAHGNVAEIEKEDELEEDLDLEALLNELNEEKEDEEESEESEEEEEEGEPLDLENMTDEDLKKMIEDVIADMMGSGELELEKSEEEMPGEEVGAEEEEEINLEELLAEIATLTEDEEEYEAELEETKEDLDEDYASIAISTPEVIGGVLAALGIVGAAAAGTIKDIMKAKSKKEVADIVAKAKESSTELEEAYSTIESLRKDLNEVNLLNAKLLYTNKIFKAKNLTESQKVNVLGMFDKATNVGEVKLVFETLSEGLKAKPTAIKENLGSASKTIGTTNTKQPIVESDPMVARFQKLAGIIKD